MFGMNLQFAHGAPQPGSAEEEVEKIVIGMFPPADLIAAYRMGLVTYNTSDLVLVVAKHDPEIISAWPRQKYVENALRRCTPKQLSTIRLAQESAHKTVQLPAESTAFWLVIEINQFPAPIMTVLFATPYETSAVSN